MHIFACIKYLDVNVVVEKNSNTLCLCFSLLWGAFILEGFLWKFSNSLHYVNSGILKHRSSVWWQNCKIIDVFLCLFAAMWSSSVKASKCNDMQLLMHFKYSKTDIIFKWAYWDIGRGQQFSKFSCHPVQRWAQKAGRLPESPIMLNLGFSTNQSICWAASSLR